LIVALLGCSLVALPLCVSATALAAGTTTLTFKEGGKGESFAYVDNAPKAQFEHGNPELISAGDELVLQTPLSSGGRRIGRLQATCTATKTSPSSAGTDFMCQGTFIFGKSTMVGSALIIGKKTEGAITGGTGIYAGAQGTIVTHGKTTTITLTE
jgi:hypothetical protein